MKRLLFLSLLYVLPANANIVPNFVQGNMQSTTSTVTTISESITSKDYKTGYEYTVTRVGVSMDGDSITPPPTTIDETVNGTVYTWTGLDLSSKPNWEVTSDAFQFTETYHGAGLQNMTIIQRNIESESVVTSTSVFSQ